MKTESRYTLESYLQSGMPGSMSYAEYQSLVAELHAQNRTTGPNQSEQYLHFSKMNETRMKRLDKTVEILPEYAAVVSQIAQKQIWIVITEAWCGDAAQSLPVIDKLASLNPNIEVRYVLRDDGNELIEGFLTNGGRSIPKLIVTNQDSEVLFDWGPRPEALQEKVLEYRNSPEPKPDYSRFQEEIQLWYFKDKTQSIQQEIVDGLK